MPVTILIVIAGGCVFGIIASVVMSWASTRSALWNMMFGGILAFGVLAGALIIALVLARTAYP